ncbi:MAG: radical SAM protein [Planctomycetes bacterium]|nr:radical SAM protein [Planctomycetota bacterium]
MLSSILKNQGPGSADTSRKKCLLFWQITGRPAEDCPFCLPAGNSSRPDLNQADCLKILDSFISFLRQNHLRGDLIFAGGDPLLRKDFWDILKAADEYRRAGAIDRIIISGRPFPADGDIVSRLKSADVSQYRFSLHHRPSIYDTWHYRGRFQEVLMSLRELRAARIRTAIKFTLTRSNARELPHILRLAVAEGVSAFNINPLISPANGGNNAEKVLTPLEYRRLLVKVLEFLDTLGAPGHHFSHTLLGAEHLFARLFHELGRWPEYQELISSLGARTSVFSKGLTFFVLSDGAVYPRRLIPVQIGRAPRDSFRQIYESSELLRSLEDEEYTNRKKAGFAKCRACPAVDYCGSMLGNSYQISGSPYAPNPFCWVEPVY